jgi:hypothetical protein
LIHPITKTLCNCNLVNGQIMVQLNAGQDYILKDPVVLTHPVVIQGGHNIVWIGGLIRFPASVAPSYGIQLGYNVGAGGILHLEGIWLDGVNGTMDDGIVGGQYAAMSMPAGTLSTAILQVENVRVGPVLSNGTNHPDCIQHYGGWKALRIDHFTCTSGMQGLYFPTEESATANKGILSKWDVRNANLYDHAPLAGQTFETLFHFGDAGSGSFTTYSKRQDGNLSNVWINSTQRTFVNEVYPTIGSVATGCVVHATLAANGLSQWWSNTWNSADGLGTVTGVIYKGIPAGGDFVPPGTAGLNYTRLG